MSYDTIMSRAADVQEAAVEAALLERADWLAANKNPEVEEDSKDPDTYKTLPHAWPPDPMDTDIIDSIPEKYLWLATRLFGSASGASTALNAITWQLAALPDNGVGEQQVTLRAFGARHENKGEAVNEISDYMGSVANASGLQQKVVDELLIAVTSCEDLLTEAKDRVEDIATQTISCLETQGAGGGGSVALGLLGAAFGVAASIGSAGAATAFGVLAAAAGGAGSLLGEGGEDGEESEISGYDVVSKLESMAAALEKADRHLQDRETEIDHGLKADLALLENDENGYGKLNVGLSQLENDENRYWEKIVPGTVQVEVSTPYNDRYES